jgi:hypothetical protein
VQYEFVIRAEGFAISHYYRRAFPRSSRSSTSGRARIADADKDARAWSR